MKLLLVLTRASFSTFLPRKIGKLRGHGLQGAEKEYEFSEHLLCARHCASQLALSFQAKGVIAPP